jgi:hypothetical protein
MGSLSIKPEGGFNEKILLHRFEYSQEDNNLFLLYAQGKVEEFKIK